MPEVMVTVLGELHKLLSKHSRFARLEIEFSGRQSIKHIVESIGIPHTEIGLLTLNGQFTNFSYLVKDKDEVIVHPARPDIDRYSGMFNDGRLVIEPNFILDNHLGKLATYLRILGFDAMYDKDYQDDDLENDAVKFNRILLTRDRQLLMRKNIRFGYLVRSLEPEVQTREVIQRFELTGIIKPFNRCLRCNQKLIIVEKEDILQRLEPKTKKYFHNFRICTECERVYWKGSHYDRMEERIAEIISQLGE